MMRALVCCATSCLLLACGGGGSTTSDAGGAADAAAPADASVPPDAGLFCDEDVPVPDGGLVFQKAGAVSAMPVGEGGTLVDGTYFLTDGKSYGPVSSNDTESRSLKFTGSKFIFSGIHRGGTLARSGGDVSFPTATTIKFDTNCFVPGGGAGTMTSDEMEYTAKPASLLLIYKSKDLSTGATSLYVKQ